MPRRKITGESKPSRSANNSGTIRQRADGRWEARVTVGVNPVTGKQIRQSIYGSTQNEVRKAMIKVLAKIDNGTFVVPNRVTVAEWLDEWLKTFCSISLKQYTINGYSVVIENHLKPNIGDMKLQDVKGLHIQRMYNKLISEGSAPKTVKNIGAVAHKAFSVAVKQGLISNNPCDAAELPRVPRHEIKPLTDDDIPLFLKLISGHPMENAFAVCLIAGLREGECLGLSWRQVDFENGVIVVDQQLQRHKEKGGKYFIAPFTKSDRPRQLVLPPIVFEYLKKERNTQKINQVAAGPKWENEFGLVFTNKNGKHLAFATFYYQFKDIVKEMGRPELRPHDLRHTCATVAIATGSDVKSVQNLLGHATASFTLNVYAHASQKMMEETALKVQNYYQNLNV